MFAKCHSRNIVIKVVSDSFLYLLPKWVLQETALVAGSSLLIRLSPASARPLGLLPLGVSAPWTFATLFTFLLACIRWLTKRVCPWKHIFLEVQTLWNLWSDIAMHWIVTLLYQPLCCYGTNYCHRDPMVNTEVIRMGNQLDSRFLLSQYRFVQMFHNPVAKVTLCQTQE